MQIAIGIGRQRIRCFLNQKFIVRRIFCFKPMDLNARCALERDPLQVMLRQHRVRILANRNKRLAFEQVDKRHMNIMPCFD